MDDHSFAGCPITSADQITRGIPWLRGGTSRSPGRCAAPDDPARGGLINLTYVSESRIAADDVAAEIGSILAAAGERNRRDQVTGALLFTGTHFVQTLEGPAPVVAALLAGIERDPRHAGLCVIDRRAVAARGFSHWSLAYVGPSLFVARTVARGVAGFHLGLPGDVTRLLTLMREFAAAPPLSWEP